MSSLVLAFQRLIRVGNKGVSLYFGLPSTRGSLFCSKNEHRYPFFHPATVPSGGCPTAQALQNSFVEKIRPIAPPHGYTHANPLRGESEPLTGRKMSPRVISGTAGAFETG